MPRYRHLKVTRWDSKGKKRTYRNLRRFFEVCSTRNPEDVCRLRNLRCLRDTKSPLYGGGIATVDVGDGDHRSTWRLHFESCTTLKDSLRKRVIIPQRIIDAEMVRYDALLAKGPADWEEKETAFRMKRLLKGELAGRRRKKR